MKFSNFLTASSCQEIAALASNTVYSTPATLAPTVAPTTAPTFAPNSTSMVINIPADRINITMGINQEIQLYRQDQFTLAVNSKLQFQAQSVFSSRVAFSGSMMTSLPAAPLDGEMAVLVDSTLLPSFVWSLRYNAQSGFSSRWDFLGGSALTLSDASVVRMAVSTVLQSWSSANPVVGINHAGNCPNNLNNSNNLTDLIIPWLWLHIVYP